MPLVRVLFRARAELRVSGLAAWRALVRLLNGSDLTHAAAIAYYSLLSLFPFLLLVFSILGVVTADDEDRLAVLAFALRYIPTRIEFVDTQLEALRQTRLQTGAAGGFVLVWAALGVFGAITTAVNQAWGVENQRSFLKHRLVSFLMFVAGSGVMIAAVLFVSVVKVAEASWFGAMVARLAWLRALQSLAFASSATILLILALGLVYYFLPNAKIRLRDVWAGAILTGIVWRLAFEGFSWYVGSGVRLMLVHGSITAVVVFLLWIYVSSVILMYGVEFTAAHARLRRGRSDEMPGAQGPRL